MRPAGLQTCGLCREAGEIQSSHLLPAWCYRRITEDYDDLHPVHVTRGSAILSSEQVREYLLCLSCENRFGKIEDKVERLTRRRDGQQLIFKKLTHIGGLTGQLYALDAETADVLSYFAVSVIWRSHAMGRGCQLGAYGDEFRHYLLGRGDFPASAVIMVMVLDPSGLEVDPKGWLTEPASTRADRFRVHGLIVCGLVFRLFVGRQIPAQFKEVCLGRTGGPKLIHVRPWNECEDAMGALRLLTQTTARGKLARLSST